MPVGVEHSITGFFTGRETLGLNITLMPLGVEHPQKSHENISIFYLNITLMPLGVEHRYLQTIDGDSQPEYNFDADRR